MLSLNNIVLHEQNKTSLVYKAIWRTSKSKATGQHWPVAYTLGTTVSYDMK